MKSLFILSRTTFISDKNDVILRANLDVAYKDTICINPMIDIAIPLHVQIHSLQF